MKLLAHKRLVIIGLLWGATMAVERRAAAWPLVGAGPNTSAPGAAAAAASGETFGTTGAPPAATDAPAPVCPPCPCAPVHYDSNIPQAAPSPYAQYPDNVPPLPPPVPNGPPSGEHEHDGFYLRTFLGPVGTRFRSQSASPTTISGGGASFGLAMGGHLGDNFILYGEFNIAGPSSPVTVTGPPLPFSISEADVIGIGVGAAYYLMPANVYLSTTLLATDLTLTDMNNNDHSAASGVGVSLMLGKEWWASADWGLGVAGQAMFATFGGGDLGPDRWRTTTWALVLSATYN